MWEFLTRRRQIRNVVLRYTYLLVKVYVLSCGVTFAATVGWHAWDDIQYGGLTEDPGMFRQATTQSIEKLPE
jgi:hypothetical protein